MADSDVWISTKMMEATGMRFESNLDLPRDTYIEGRKRNERGEAGPREGFPTELYAVLRTPDDGLPELTFATTYVVTERVASVLATAELGRTELYPVKVFERDRTSLVPGTYYCIAFREQKTGFVPEMSPSARLRPHQTPHVWDPPFSMNPGDIAVTPHVVEGPELWMDPRLRLCFFVSGRLAEKLNAAGLIKALTLNPCKVLST